jgi:hypothetical protein
MSTIVQVFIGIVVVTILGVVVIIGFLVTYDKPKRDRVPKINRWPGI